MPLATAWIALALLGLDDDQATEQPLIRYEIRVLEMKGLDWRGKAHDRLAVVSRQGTATVWTGPAGLAKDLVKSSGKVVASPRISSAPDRPAVFRHEDTTSYVLDMKRVADGPYNHATAVAYNPEVGQVRDQVHCSISGDSMDQGTLAHVEIEHEKLAGLHSYTVSETIPDAKSGPTTLAAKVQVPEVIAGRVEGDWLIPQDGVLIVGLGLYSAQSGTDGASPCERVVLIEARKGTVSTEAGHSKVASLPLPPVAIGRSTLEAPAHLAIVRPLTPPPVFALATPTPPSRALPTPLAKDGSVVELPPLPDEIAPVTDSEPSAEPRAAAQARPISPQGAAPTPEHFANRSFVDLITCAADAAVAAAASSPTCLACPGSARCESSRKLTLDEAVRTSLANSKTVRTVDQAESTDAKGAIRVETHPEAGHLVTQDELTAHVRSIEQEYWALSMAQSHRDAAEKALGRVEEILAAEKACQPADPNRVAEAEAAEAWFRCRRDESTVEVEAVGKQLGRLIGVPSSDSRRLVAETPPTDPGHSRISAAELAAKIGSLGARFEDGERSAEVGRELRTCMTLDSEARHCLAAEQLGRAAKARCEEQKVFYEAKKVSLSRYLDAVRADMVADCQLAEFRCRYSTSLAALAEQDGSLLAHHRVELTHARSTVDPQAGRVDYQEKAQKPRSRSFRIVLGPNLVLRIQEITTDAGTTEDDCEGSLCAPPSE